MARAATCSDVFNAVAEPQRRVILALLAPGERPVGDLVDTLRIPQPSVSKHLRVLREVGLVDTRRDGRHVLYRTNAEAIKPIYRWAAAFEQFWSRKLQRIKARAESAERATSGPEAARGAGDSQPERPERVLGPRDQKGGKP